MSPFLEPFYLRSCCSEGPYYVPDLEIDIHNFFSPKSNPGLEFSDVQPFIACDENGKVVGRVAAIINHKANKTWNVKNVRFGFLDFVDDIDVAAALLRKVETWVPTVMCSTKHTRVSSIPRHARP